MNATTTSISTKSGGILDALVLFSTQPGRCKVEIYENGSPQPSSVKYFNWIVKRLHSYPNSGSYGTNLLSLNNGSIVQAGEYSLAMELSPEYYDGLGVALIFEGTGSYSIDHNKIQKWGHFQYSNHLGINCEGQGIIADMSIKLIGEGKLTIQFDHEAPKTIEWK